MRPLSTRPDLSSTTHARRAAIAALLVLALSRPAAAQTEEQAPASQDLADLSLEQLLDMEVQSVFGASRFLQRTTEAPASVTVVTADEIARFGWRTLADVLRSVRGFYVTDDRSWGYVGVRGFQRPGDYNQRLLLLLDGERINDNVYDQALVQEDAIVDMATVDRIEVIRGPSSSLYGSNAFFGVINVVTRPAGAPGGAGVSFDAGTLGTRAARITVGRAGGSGLSAGLTASGWSSHGVDALYFPEYDDPQNNNGIAQDLDSVRRRNLLGQLSYKGLSVHAAYNRRVRGYPSGAYGTIFNSRLADVSDEQFFVSSGFEGALGNGWTTATRVGVHHYAYVGHYPYDPAGTGEAIDNTDIGRGTWVGGDAAVSRRLGRTHRVTVGVEPRYNVDMTLLNYDDAATPFVAARKQSWTVGGYAQDEWRPLAPLLFNVGVRVDRYAGFENPITPRLAAIYTPNAHTAVKLLYGQAFRAPNVYETDYEAPTYRPNELVVPETIHTTEAVVERYAGSRLRLSASVYRYTVSRLIDLLQDPGTFTSYYGNLAAAEAKGLEAEAEAKWPSGLQTRLSYALSRVRDTDGLPLSNAPAHVTQGLVAVPLGRQTFLGVDARALSARHTRTGALVGAHVVVNGTLSGQLAAGRLRWSATVANVFDQQYADPVSTDFLQEVMPQNGRTAWLRVFLGL